MSKIKDVVIDAEELGIDWEGRPIEEVIEDIQVMRAAEAYGANSEEAFKVPTSRYPAKVQKLLDSADTLEESTPPEELGKQAFMRGLKRAPMLDKEFMKTMAGRKTSDPRTVPEMLAWHSGWDAANLFTRI